MASPRHESEPVVLPLDGGETETQFSMCHDYSGRMSYEMHESDADHTPETAPAPVGDEIREQLLPVSEVITRSNRIVVFTGAGISTESGIPDYRGPNGVWKTNRIPTIQDVKTDRQSREQRWEHQRRRYPEMQAKEPNPGHRAIAALQDTGRVSAIVTQNIDGLHQKAGSPDEHVLELHGSSHRVRCSRCGRLYDSASIHARLESGERDPACEVCGGVLRPSTILFGESLPAETLSRAAEESAAADLILVVGSSLVVKPASQLPVVARKRGADLIIVNREPTPLDNIATAVIRGESGPVLETLVHLVIDHRPGATASVPVDQLSVPDSEAIS